MPKSTRRPLRVLFVARYYYWWDRPRAGMLHLAMSPLGLMERGHEVRFICERRAGQELDDDGVDVRWFDAPFGLDPTQLYASARLGSHPALRSALVRAAHLAYVAGAYRTALAACQDWTPDVVYCQAEAPAPAATPIARRFGAKLVLHAYGGMSVDAAALASRLWRTSHYLDVVFAYRCGADAYLIVDDGTGGDELARRLGAPASAIHHWDIPVALPAEPPAEPARAQLGIPEGAPVILAAARMVPIKRMDLCLDSMITLLRADGRTYAVLVGDGPMRAELERQVANLPATIAGRIRFTGYLPRERFSHLLASSDIFLTLQEGSVSGTNLRDAMLHGRCVVAVRRVRDRAVGSLISSGTNGLLVDESEIHRVPDVLLELVRDPERRRRLGQAALATARERFQTWPQRIDAEERLLRQLVEGS